MKLYKTDYHNISKEDRKVWKELEDAEIVYRDGKPTMIRNSLYHEFPKSARHYMSLFPNNFIDAVDLTKISAELHATLSQFEILLEKPDTTERHILNFLRDEEAYFIVGSLLKKDYRFGHHALFIFPEFNMPPSYKADYLLVGENSDGHHFVFVEFENVYGDITVKNGDYGKTIRKGIKQIDDWEFWLEKNFSHLELVFESSKNKSKLLPDEFRGFDRTRIHYVIVAGRRKDYSERTYRLRRSNRDQRKLSIIHYDNLVDYAKATIGTSTY